MKNKKKKYLFLYLKTGGGHLSPAKSIVNYLNKYFNDSTDSRLADGFKETNHFIKYAVEDGYRQLQAKAKWFYEFLYLINKVPLIAKINCAIISYNTEKYLEKVIDEYQPDKIIICHFFLIQPVYKIRRKKELDTTILTLVTDPYTAHPMWFLRKKQNFILFSERLKKHTSKIRPESNVSVFPFILDEKFSKRIDEKFLEKIKDKLGFPLDKKIVLILGGGDGIPNGNKILVELLKQNLDAVIAVVCGKNESFYNESLKLKEKFNRKNFFVFGYIDFVYELLNVSHTIITKCGASTMMEILLINKVPVVNSFIWEQEKGNIEFLIENNLGIYEPDIKKLGELVMKLITDENYYDYYYQNILKKNFRNGLQDITEFLIS